jgi:hypothetical protein
VDVANGFLAFNLLLVVGIVAGVVVVARWVMHTAGRIAGALERIATALEKRPPA